MRLIDADKLKNKFWHGDLVPHEEMYHISEINYAIDNAPTVTPSEIQVMMKDYLVYRSEPERPHGRWILHKDYNERKYGCNQCGNLNNIPSNFCPNCGADMRKEEE